MKTFSLPLIATLAAALGLAGCSSPAGARGEAQVGDTPEQVQSVMGKPDGKQDGPNAGEQQAVWVYTNYHKKRPETTGWREVLVPGIKNQNDNVVQEPVTRDVYRTQLKEAVRVVFTDGLVSSIEHLER